MAIQDKHDRSSAMTTADALRVLIDLRTDDQVVITNQGSAREWPKLADHPLDFHFLPSAMGAAIPLGLGIALAQPQREVIVITGDGSLLMNLGSLVTVTASRAANLTIVLLDNGVYAVTGGQKTPAWPGRVDYVGLATAAGFRSVTEFNELTSLQNRAADALTAPGPRLIRLAIQAERHILPTTPLAPIADRIEQLRQSLLD